MEKKEMTDLEFFTKIEKEVSEYQIGLHNIGKQSFMQKALEYPSKYLLESEDVTEENIAKRILTTGLNVPLNKPYGMRSTVVYRSLSPYSFGWCWNLFSVSEYPETICNVVIGIPYFLEVEGKEYFIGDLTDTVEYRSIANYVLFSERVNPEFIYGYYTKRLLEVPTKENPFGFQFANDLEFHENPMFWKNLSKIEQTHVIQEVLDSNLNAFLVMKLANNDAELSSLDSKSREIIKRTRIQRQNYLQR